MGVEIINHTFCFFTSEKKKTHYPFSIYLKIDLKIIFQKLQSF